MLHFPLRVGSYPIDPGLNHIKARHLLACRLLFQLHKCLHDPIRDGIPIMLESEARTLSDEELEALPPRTPLVE